MSLIDDDLFGGSAHLVHIAACIHPVYDASRMQVPDATQNLVEQVRHPLMVQVHVDHLA